MQHYMTESKQKYEMGGWVGGGGGVGEQHH